MSISPARKAAFDILLRIERERAYSSVLLPQYEEHLSPVDRGLCHEIVLGTLRRQIRLDRIIDQLAGGRKLDIEVRIALRLGLYQLLDLERVPASAAINESVELVKRAKKTSAAGFANAILRRASREQIEVGYSDDLDRVSVETSHPRWLIERWAGRLGVEAAERVASSNNEPPRTAFRVLGGAGEDAADLIAASRLSASVAGCYLLDRSTPALKRLVYEDKVYLQDEASQMVAHAVDVSDNGSFFDVCASPGGKTGLVAAVSRPALIVAGDLYQQRAELLRENCLRQGADVKVVRYDAAAAIPFADQAFDAALVDAPCTGTGTIRHNPEIRYFLRAEDIDELSLKQRRILAQASKAVKKGGLLVYSTCSLEPEEGEDVAKWFLGHVDGFEQVRPGTPDEFITEGGFARTWPHRDGMDGFFIAAFRRL